jgi:hypothetical protein
MATTSEALGAYAAPHEMKLGGKMYRFGLITQRVKSEFERFLAGTAMQAIADFKGIMGSEGYAISLEGIRREIASGIYAWNGPVFMEAMGTIRGISQLLASVSFDVELKRTCTADEIVDLISKYDVELRHVFGVILEESFPTNTESNEKKTEMESKAKPSRTRSRSTQH